jgi:hypothetical protein
LACNKAARYVGAVQVKAQMTEIEFAEPVQHDVQCRAFFRNE